MPLDQSPHKDVFLSHSGTQKNFVRQLHADLDREHVSCFFDENRQSLPLAESWPDRIFKAAQTCKIAVLVLSNEFLLSKWPMLELSEFISAKNSGENANLKLFPIFYEIIPKELSDITKVRKWQKFKERHDRRGNWEDALNQVRLNNGLHFVKGGHEVALRAEIVKQICFLLEQINPKSRPRLLEFKPVGIEKQVEDVKALLDTDMKGAQSVLAVIVCGFGGVGKSTLAASVVESLDWSTTDFKFCRVAIDEKKPDRSSHIIQLQKYIICDLGGGEVDLRDPDEGRHRIKEALQKKHSLLFIDNVDKKDYIKDLLPKDLSSCEQETKLRIIITSREKNVRAELSIICKEYEVQGLSDSYSKSLLLETIFQNQADEAIGLDEERLIDEVAAACKGVPLLLSVFGNHLRGDRDKESYEEVLKVLRDGDLDRYREEDLGTRLMFVYNKINNVEVKEAFLDICTYFHGWKWNLVADIVDIDTLKDLHRRMLLSKSGSEEVIVHDILRLMGLKDARRTRFSNYKEFSDALEENLGNVKGISLLSDNHITIQSTQLEAVHESLRVLMLGDWVTLNGLCHRAFRNLRYLRLGDTTSFPFRHPSKLDKLRVFLNMSKPGMNLSHLPSSLKRICHEVPPDVECNKFVKLPFQNLCSLKCFIIKTWMSVELPEELQLPASLVDLELSGCKNLPKDIGHLTALESLILDKSDMKCLPQGFGKLKKLKHLSMNHCSKLASLSEELGMLSSLKVLSIDGCRNLNLRALPKSLGRLLSLQNLKLRESINLQLLPESLGVLRIHTLNLYSLVSLHELPSSFGNMPLLKYLSLESCHSLMSLPDSIVQLKTLDTLIINDCTKLSVLPENFGRLRYLKVMTVEYCPLLKELPREFGALPALKDFWLRWCDSFVNLPRDFTKMTSLETLHLENLHNFENLPRDFTELTSLEELHLKDLPLVSRIPNGLGKLKKFRSLFLKSFWLLKTLPDDFENMATLEQLQIENCPELDGAMMGKILKLQNCYKVDIYDSTKLLKTWKMEKSKVEHPILVRDGYEFKNSKEQATRVALLHGKCMELKHTNDGLMERSSLLGELEEGSRATVALIMLPIHMQSLQHQILQRFVKMARETAKANEGGKLLIVCARKYARNGQMVTASEEEGCIRQILLLLPRGSCAILSAESRRVKLLTDCCDWFGCHDPIRLNFIMANAVVYSKGRNTFENVKFIEDDEIPGNMVTKPLPSLSKILKPNNRIQKFIESLCYRRYGQSQCVAGQSKTTEFVEALKGNEIHHLLIGSNRNKVVVDDLDGKAIGFIISDFKILEFIKLQQTYKDIQQKDSNFIAIWIPPDWPENCGHGTYTRLIQYMPWAAFPHPQLVNVTTYSSASKCPRFVVLGKDGQIANYDAMPLLSGWGVKSYPFTEDTLPESFSLMESESCLEVLLNGMNIVGRKLMKSKMTFLYAERPSEWHKMKCKLEELTHIRGNFEVLYVGKFHEKDFHDIEKLKQDYEDATQNMCWPSLSFSDMIMFWYRCRYMVEVSATKKGLHLNKEPSIMMETLLRLGSNLRVQNIWLVLVDNNGAVTYAGYDVLRMICESSDEISNREAMATVKDELMESLSRGECTPIVKTFFRDQINFRGHTQQHTLSSPHRPYLDGKSYRCDVCFCERSFHSYQQRSYVCGGEVDQQVRGRWSTCEWRVCGRCWMAYAQEQVEQLLLAKDN